MGGFPRLFRTERSLRTQLWLWIALPATLGLLALSIIELYAHEQSMRQLVNERAQDRAQAVAALLDVQVVRLQERLVEFVHSSQHTETNLPERFMPGGVAHFDANGRPLDVRSAPWAGEADVLTLVRQMIAAHPNAAPRLLTLPREPATVVLAVSGHDGTVWMAGQPVDALFQAAISRTNQGEHAASLALFSGSAPVGRSRQPGDQTRALVGSATVATTGWTVQVSQSWGDMFSPLLRVWGTVGAVMIIAASISGLAAYFGMRYVVRPLRRLNAATVRAGWGDAEALDQRVEGVAEIEELRLALLHMTDQVRRYQDQLRTYLDAMTLGQEEERKRLARELHDETVQTMIALNQQIELAERDLSIAPERAADRLRGLRPLVTEAVNGLRRQILALRPLYLEDLGFVPALETLVRQTTHKAGIMGDFEVTGVEVQDISPALEITVFRIVQEALNNTVAHARASWVHVELEFRPTEMGVCVEDDGIGFRLPDHPVLLAQEGHYGLLGMHERAAAHGGRLNVRSELTRGTRIEVCLPIQPSIPADPARFAKELRTAHT